MHNVGSLLVGTALGVLASLFTLWFVTPRVQRRMRAQERWEADVLALGELLSSDIAEASERAERTWNTHAFVLELQEAAKDDSEAQRERIAEILRRDAEAMRQADQEYDRLLNVRAQWLVSRVAALDSPETEGLAMAHRTLYLFVPHHYLNDGAWTDETKEKWDKEHEQRRDLLKRVERAATLIDPPPGRSWRERQRRKRRTAKVAREQADQKVGQEK